MRLSWVLVASVVACSGDGTAVVDGGGGSTPDGGAGTPDAATSTPDAGPDAGPAPYGTLTAAPNDQPKFGGLPPYGYYEYLPSRYDDDPSKMWPAIVFLTGIGEIGNGNTELIRVLNTGLPGVIDDGEFPAHDRFVVLMPQHSDFFGPDRIDEFLAWAKMHYRLDEERIYLTGLSYGAIATLDYGAARGDATAFAAYVPISGDAAGEGCQYENTPMWFFHGLDDANMYTLASMSIDSVMRINACAPPVPAKVTIYTGCGHAPCAWDRTYDLTGMTAAVDAMYAPYDQSVYDWMLQYTR